MRDNEGHPKSARWQAIAACVDDYEQHRGASPRDLRPIAEQAGVDHRLAALEELIRVDLEFRVNQSEEVRLEDYFETYPELAKGSLTLEDLRKVVQTTLERRDGLAHRALEASNASGTDGESAEIANGDRYRILRELGAGGMGTVYLAEDRRLGRKVALKIPNIPDHDGEEMEERFHREARAAALLRHPNICPVHDVGVLNEIPYLTMAYIEGRPLSEICAQGERMPAELAARLVRSVALALHDAHEQGIIHRDLKPANIMVDSRGEPIVTDFGLASLVDQDDQRLTRFGAAVGTPAYMPPEHWDGSLRSSDRRSDIFSLGVIMYELLSGHLPFQGTVPDVIDQLRIKEPSFSRSAKRSIDPRLATIALRAMARRPEDRYETAADLALALKRYLDSKERSRWMRLPSRPVGIAVTGVAALLLVALTFAASNGFGARATRLPTSPGLAPVEMLGSAEEIDLTVDVQRADWKQDFFRLHSRSESVRIGDLVRITVDLDEASYLYLYWYDADARPHRLWPPSDNITHQSPVRHHTSPPTLPESELQPWHEVGSSPGTEMILALASDRPLDEGALALFEERRPKLLRDADKRAGTPEHPVAVSSQRVVRETERAPVGVVASRLGGRRVLDEDFESVLRKQFSSYSGIVFPFQDVVSGD
ncbi:Serine/threonine-protein kinase PrkC [Planctomycetes bacterium Pan216]|uniref:Serine/threonine-protein kinase PrkC n=1 Tax=Kolteria novifilia TaxID=2527975 RepID=A0A518B662_9BACT|nr:Serine/threonine-protein kinase PrkC [Planctomycetes bacterium Pan216]